MTNFLTVMFSIRKISKE